MRPSPDPPIQWVFFFFLGKKCGITTQEAPYKMNYPGSTKKTYPTALVVESF
jgi:hypothetical protein